MWPGPVSGHIWKDLPGSGSQHELRFRHGTRQGALGGVVHRRLPNQSLAAWGKGVPCGFLWPGHVGGSVSGQTSTWSCLGSHAAVQESSEALVEDKLESLANRSPK